MPNNYILFSTVFHCPMYNRERLIKAIKAGLLARIEGDDFFDGRDRRSINMKKMADGKITLIDTHFELKDYGIWIYSEADGDIQTVVEVVSAVQEEFELDEPFFFSWAYTCSKPHFDKFGGGAVCVRRGHDHEWIDAADHLQNMIRENHDALARLVMEQKLEVIRDFMFVVEDEDGNPVYDPDKEWDSDILGEIGNIVVEHFGDPKTYQERFGKQS